MHDALDPEMSILKQRLARRLRHDGATDESVKTIDLGEWQLGRQCIYRFVWQQLAEGIRRQHACARCHGCRAECLHGDDAPGGFIAGTRELTCPCGTLPLPPLFPPCSPDDKGG